MNEASHSEEMTRHTIWDPIITINITAELSDLLYYSYKIEKRPHTKQYKKNRLERALIA